MNFISYYFKKFISLFKFKDKNLTKVDASSLIKVVINDSFEPFPMNLTPVSSSLLPMTITVYKGGGYALGTLEQQAAEAFIVIDKALRYMNGKNAVPFKKWAATSNLLVKCRAGQDLNAYYDRSSLRFFYWPISNGMFYTCDSTDIVSHELGHAILDIIRPDIWNISGYETFAFHEAFGDITAMLGILQWDVVINAMLQETGNDLTKSNCVSRISEAFGALLVKLDPNSGYLPYALRDGVNSFRYQKPETLPSDTPDSQLSNEVHNFSRIFTGAWYDIFVKIYQKLVSQSMDRVLAVKTARDVCADYILYGASNAPASPRFYNAVAQKMILRDKLRGSKYANELKTVFTNRNILLPSLAILNEVDIKQIEAMPNITKNEYDDHIEINLNHKNKFSLKDVTSLGIKSSIADDVVMEIPYQESFSFNKAGVLMQHISSNKEEAIQDAVLAYEFMKKHNLILSSEENKDKAWFKVSMKNLQRIRFNCRCQQNNCCIEGSPEYGKCYKQQNNSGCVCCGKRYDPCKCQEEAPPAPPKIGCFVKSNKVGNAAISYCSKVSRKVC